MDVIGDVKAQLTQSGPGAERERERESSCVLTRRD